MTSWFTAFAAEIGALSARVDQLIEATLATGGCWLWDTPEDTAVSLAVRVPWSPGAPA